MVLGDTTIDWVKVYKKRDLSYRLWKRLLNGGDWLTLYKDEEIQPNDLLLIMKIHKMYVIPLKKLIRKLPKIIEAYEAWLPTRNIPFQKTSKDKYLAKELAFRGFVPIAQFDYSNTKFCYVMSNRSIENTIWVYPMKFTLNYDQLQKDIKKGKDINIRYIYPNFAAIALQGCTKIQYCNL